MMSGSGLSSNGASAAAAPRRSSSAPKSSPAVDPEILGADPQNDPWK